jgi:hypothetical protein
MQVVILKVELSQYLRQLKPLLSVLGCVKRRQYRPYQRGHPSAVSLAVTRSDWR